MTNFYQQIRDISTGRITAASRNEPDDVDMDVRVRQPRDGQLRFEVALWNINAEHWENVNQGGPVELRLGWKEDAVEPVCEGVIERKYMRQEETNAKYVVTGIDKSAARLGRSRSKTFKNKSVGQIARGIASEAGISAGRVENGPLLRGFWTIKKTHNLRYWLRRLRKRAEEETGEQWEFWTAAGKLHFARRKATEQQVMLIQSSNAIVDPVTGQTSKSKGGNELEFDAYVDPRIQKNAYVAVQTERHSGVYKIAEYEINSSTESGSHEMTGTLAPADAQYEIVSEIPGHGSGGSSLGTALLSAG